MIETEKPIESCPMREPIPIERDSVKKRAIPPDRYILLDRTKSSDRVRTEDRNVSTNEPDGQIETFHRSESCQPIATNKWNESVFLNDAYVVNEPRSGIAPTILSETHNRCAPEFVIETMFVI